MRAVRPDRGEELSRRAGGHPVPAPLAKRLSGFLEVRGLAGSRCSGLASVPPHLNDSETVASDLFASVVQALDLSQVRHWLQEAQHIEQITVCLDTTAA